MAFQQGLSGLASSSRAIDVVSNNIANANTVGFKASTTQFADVYASALTGAVSTIQVGIGAAVTAVKQSFTQGNLTTTNSPLDLAINGDGFFRIARNDGTFAYTRNGQFDVDDEGFLITPTGERLTGYQIDPATDRIGDTLGPLQIPRDEAPSRATGSIDGVMIRANLDARAESPANSPFSPSDIDSYNSTTSLTVFDSQGIDHTLTLYFARTSVAADNTVRVYAALDGGTPQELTDAANLLTFGTDGRLDTSVAGNGVYQFTEALTNGAADLDFPIDLTNLTQFGSAFSVTEMTQDGFSSGQVAGFSVSRDGTIQGRYTNGQTRDLGRVALVTFRSPNGLTSLGNNLWAESPESGPATPGSPGTGLNGVITAGMVEDSNVDLTQELVQLIIQQRNYQANAQSIRTQDQLLQTLVSLR